MNGNGRRHDDRAGEPGVNGTGRHHDHNAAEPGDGLASCRRVLSVEEQISALELGVAFPGYFPVVVIARAGATFLADLTAVIGEAQGEAPFEIRERPSSHGRYVAYHVQMYVESARDALDRREALAALAGVVMLL
jgi:putative lipoic acid-binding regulatory protein